MKSIRGNKRLVAPAPSRCYQCDRRQMHLIVRMNRRVSFTRLPFYVGSTGEKCCPEYAVFQGKSCTANLCTLRNYQARAYIRRNPIPTPAFPHFARCRFSFCFTILTPAPASLSYLAEYRRRRSAWHNTRKGRRRAAIYGTALFTTVVFLDNFLATV